LFIKSKIQKLQLEQYAKVISITNLDNINDCVDKNHRSKGNKQDGLVDIYHNLGAAFFKMTI